MMCKALQSEIKSVSHAAYDIQGGFIGLFVSIAKELDKVSFEGFVVKITRSFI